MYNQIFLNIYFATALGLTKKGRLYVKTGGWTGPFDLDFSLSPPPPWHCLWSLLLGPISLSLLKARAGVVGIERLGMEGFLCLPRRSASLNILSDEERPFSPNP